MKKSERFVITINRELGSGGRTVGRKLAERLGVSFYDKAVLGVMKDRYNLSAEEIERLKGTGHGKWIDVKHTVTGDKGIEIVTERYYKVDPGSEHAHETTEEMFRTETEILTALAEEESCVVAGRSSFYVFRDHPNHLNILIQASLPHRIARLMRKQNLTEEQARRAIDAVDRMRENYVSAFTGTSRYDARNYHLLISMDDLSEDDAVNIIMDYIDCSNK